MVFALIALIAILIFMRNMTRISRFMALAQSPLPTDRPDLRWDRVFIIALGQKKMFKRLTPAILHLMVYVGFILINIEVAEIFVDGVLDTHRFLAPILGAAYAPFISFFEILALLVLISCAVFLVRRWIVKVPRLASAELNGWPKIDATTILVTEIVLMMAILIMNGADLAAQHMQYGGYHHTGDFLISRFIAPLFYGMPEPSLVFIERSAWWFHIIGIFLFLNYLPFSKHLHIILAFPNTYYSKLESQGKMRNMPVVQNEVKSMFDPSYVAPANLPPAPPRFGAKDVFDLDRIDILSAFSCTECGRCTAVCPANITGKKLSPRKIMMDTRDRCEELGGKNLILSRESQEDGRSLLGDYISHEEIFACTSCQACVEACPVNIDPLSIILQLRRYAIMEESSAPALWNNMFNNIENNQAPWKQSPEDRLNWAKS